MVRADPPAHALPTATFHHYLTEKTMSVLRLIAKSTAALSAIIAFTGAAASTASAAEGTEAIALAPAEVTSFEWVQGNQEWAQPNLDRLQRTVFVIYPDASFEMREPDGYTPMRGTISSDGTFSVSSSFNSGVGYASAEVSGQISVQNGVPVLSLTYTSSSAAAADVNNTAYSYSNGKAYRATATLQQVS
jgi:hypothetical protein